MGDHAYPCLHGCCGGSKEGRKYEEEEEAKMRIEMGVGEAKEGGSSSGRGIEV